MASEALLNAVEAVILARYHECSGASGLVSISQFTALAGGTDAFVASIFCDGLIRLTHRAELAKPRLHRLVGGWAVDRGQGDVIQAQIDRQLAPVMDEM